MEFVVQSNLEQQEHEQCIVVGYFNDHQLTPLGNLLNEQSAGYLLQFIKNMHDLELGETQFLVKIPNINSSILLVSCGENRALNTYQYQKLLKKLTNTLAKISAKQFYIEMTVLDVVSYDIQSKLFQLITICGNNFYQFNQCKSIVKTTLLPTKIVIYGPETADSLKTIKSATSLVEGMHLIRDLANLPPNICTPSYLAKKAYELANNYKKLNLEILDENDMEKIGMNALLAVSKGSAEPAKFICFHYQGANTASSPLVFIGKGITFDTGGISLKPPFNMDEMKFDMCGAATVFGIMQCAATLNLPLNIIGLIPTAENMPGGKATRPGDIVKSLSGQTIEILNTDAEGRLILCDALTYAERFNPKVVIDIATLTGSVIMTFDRVATGIMGNNDELVKDLLEASVESGDRAWSLPLWEEYQEMLTSNFADIPNIASSNDAKCIIAGCFLARFAKKFSWAHLDMAGVAYVNGKEKGATGRPLPLLLKFLLKQADKANEIN